MMPRAASNRPITLPFATPPPRLLRLAAHRSEARRRAAATRTRVLGSQLVEQQPDAHLDGDDQDEYHHSAEDPDEQRAAPAAGARGRRLGWIGVRRRSVLALWRAVLCRRRAVLAGWRELRRRRRVLARRRERRGLRISRRRYRGRVGPRLPGYGGGGHHLSWRSGGGRGPAWGGGGRPARCMPCRRPRCW